MNRKKKSELTDRISIKDSFQMLKSATSDYVMLVKEWITDYGKIILPLALVAAIVITIGVALNARSRVIAAAIEADETLSVEEVNAMGPDANSFVPFEENAYEAVNELVYEYYKAVAEGNAAAVNGFQNSSTEIEAIRLKAMSDYIDHYEDIVINTKPGPLADSYIAYVSSNVFLKGMDIPTPGLQAFYICTSDNGSLYFNTGELSENETAYIKSISEQADVIDLKNTINVQYMDLMEQNEDLKNTWADISVDIDLRVGAALSEEAARIAKIEKEEQAEQEALESGQTAEDDIAGTETVEETPKIIRVKTTTSVNVRKSASATADKLGSASAGKVYDVIEVMINGWTKINYDGSEGFIKSDFLETLENIDDYESLGKVAATTLLNVRSQPKQTSSKLGVLNEGETVDLIGEENGWCKIKFNGQIGYVKSDYVK